jgi:parvulin-like peptidyl-prolyl isomerase
MAREYSDDTATRNTGGELSYFTRGTMVPEFEDPLWQLDIGGISQPVKSRYGYHIIRLDDKRERENYSAPEDEEEIFYVKRQLFMAHGDSGRIVWDRQLENLKKTYGFELEKQNILNIATVITQKFYQGETGYDTFSDDQLNMTLASWRGGGLTVRDMFSSEPDRLNRLLVRYKQAQFVEQDVTSEGVRRLILADARAMGIGRDPYIVELVDNFRNMQLLQEIEKREVSDKSEASLEEAKAYYDANPEKFQQPAEIELWEIFVSDEAQARDLAERARNGENFEKLARNFSQDKKYRAKSGYLGYLSSGARGLITREAFSLGPGQKIGGPLKYRNGWVIFMTGRKKEATLRPFEDVDNRARSLIKRERLEERRRVWEDSLRSAYTVEVDTIKMKEV